jgi:hypothetical protein
MAAISLLAFCFADIKIQETSFCEIFRVQQIGSVLTYFVSLCKRKHKIIYIKFFIQFVSTVCVLFFPFSC